MSTYFSTLIPLISIALGGTIYFWRIGDKSYVCNIKVGEYEKGSNRGRIREFLVRNGAKGLQILLDKDRFICFSRVKDDGYLEGLLEYLNVVLPILKMQKNKVWAVKKDTGPDGWNILDNEVKSDDIDILEPIPS